MVNVINRVQCRNPLTSTQARNAEMNLSMLFAVAFGSALGGIVRWSAKEWLPATLSFPYSTLLVNVVGCFFAGFLWVYWQHAAINPYVKTGVLVGFLGALTTFSAFSVDTLVMVQHQQWLKAAQNVGLNVLLSLIAVFFGAWIGARIAS